MTKMYKFNDLSGKRFGKLTVIGQAGRTADRHILWECKCDCGGSAFSSGKDLVSGHTRSCGCLQKETVSRNRYKHGDRDGRLYQVWKSMIKRCENENDKSYRYYGLIGVSVCPEWHDYVSFRSWAMENGYDDKAKYGACTIDRINPYGNYEPSNCRWISNAEQQKNKRKDWDRRMKNAI